MALAVTRTVGVFGGTFDPIHCGHLRMASELKAALKLDEMRLMPCKEPPHRQLTSASVAQRVAMVECALAEHPELTLDLQELEREGPSYSVNTVQCLRQQLGGDVSLCFAMGMDSLVNLPSWYRWEELLHSAHIVVAARPGWSLPSSGPMVEYLAEHQQAADFLKRAPAGGIVIQDLSMLPISSSDIRERLQAGKTLTDLVPAGVMAYITEHGLYQS